MLLIYIDHPIYDVLLAAWTLRGQEMILSSNTVQKIRDTKGTFHAKIGTEKDRNGMDLTEAEAIRWQEYT